MSEFDGRALVAGARVDAAASVPVVNPYTGTPVASVSETEPEVVSQAVDRALSGQAELASIPVHRRAAMLRAAVALIADRKDDLAATISLQTGKALRDSLREVDRATYTVTAAASAVEQLSQPVPAADVTPGGEGLLAVASRRPLGVVAAISPFNAPFNLVMHKVAPGLAAGNGIVVKPAPQAPLSALQVAEILLEAGFPAQSISVLPGGVQTASALVSDPRVAAVSFTGGTQTAAAIGRQAPLKRLLFELGGNSANIVHSDCDIEWAAAALVAGAFSNTGQSCNSVQRLIVHRSILDQLVSAVVERTSALVTGDPMDSSTDVGTLISADAASRVASWIEEATAGGAALRTGGVRRGAQLTPTVLTDVGADMRVACEEIFGPVLTVLAYESVDEAFELANRTSFGLQASVFTRSLSVAHRAVDRLEAGTVLVNRSTNFRLDHLPFGGVKDSGTSREGGRFTVEEMTQVKLGLIDAAMAGQAHPMARS